MGELTNSVGSSGGNTVHDVALVQLLLGGAKNRAGAPYFSRPYTEKYGRETTLAIAAFQAERGLVTNGKPAVGETSGVIKPNSKTWAALRSATDQRLQAARTCRGVPVAYLPMDNAALGEGKTAAHAGSLQPEFRDRVIKLIERCYKESAIAWTLVPQTGGFRPFAGQQGLVSDAGYGESIHQYGYAVDLTVKNFAWFDPNNRSVKTSPISFSGMPESLFIQFFEARNVIARAPDIGLFGTTKEGDRFHLQAYDDASLDSVSSLMALMEAVGPRKMKWRPQFRTPTNYHCDLGLGGELYYVGTAVDIWNKSKTKRISAKDLAAALGNKKRADPKFRPETFLGRTSAALLKDLREQDIVTADIEAVQVLLKAEMEAAATQWQKWKPVYYPNKDRRPKNPDKP